MQLHIALSIYFGLMLFKSYTSILPLLSRVNSVYKVETMYLGLRS